MTKFSCPACAKQFTWKPQLAGRQVRCKCGSVFSAPHDCAPSAAPAQQVPASDEIDLYPEVDPAVHSHVPRATVITAPVSSTDPRPAATSAQATPFGAYAAHRRRKVAQTDEDDAPSAWKERYVPMALALMGVVGWLVLVTVFPARGAAVGQTLVMAGALTAANLVAMVLAMFAAAAMLSLNFGTPASAAIKLVGVALFASALFYGCLRLDPEGVRGAIAGLHVVVVVYWISFATLFDLELQETLITVSIITLLQAMTGCVVLKV